MALGFYARLNGDTGESHPSLQFLASWDYRLWADFVRQGPDSLKPTGTVGSPAVDTGDPIRGPGCLDLTSSTTDQLEFRDDTRQVYTYQTGLVGTVAFWFKVPSVPTAKATFVSMTRYGTMDPGSGAYDGLQVGWDPSLPGLYLQIYDDSNNPVVMLVHSPWTPTVGRWYHVEASWDLTQGHYRLFVDGQLVASELNGVTATRNDPRRLDFGALDSGDQSGFYLDDVAIYGGEVLHTSDFTPPDYLLALVTTTLDATYSASPSSGAVLGRPISAYPTIDNSDYKVGTGALDLTQGGATVDKAVWYLGEDLLGQLTGLDQGTVTAWVQLDAAMSAGFANSVFCLGPDPEASGRAGYVWLKQYNDSQTLQVQIYDDAGNAVVDALVTLPAPVAAGEWHHVELNWDAQAGTARLFWDGQLLQTWTPGSWNRNGDCRFVALGQPTSNFTTYTNVKVDEFQVWANEVLHTADFTPSDQELDLSPDPPTLAGPEYVNYPGESAALTLTDLDSGAFDCQPGPSSVGVLAITDFVNNGDGTGTATVQLDSTKPGQGYYTVTVYVTTPFGNSPESNAVDIQVAPAVPTVVNGPTEAVVGEQVQFTLAGVEPDVDGAELGPSAQGMAFVSLVNHQNGRATVTVQLDDTPQHDDVFSVVVKKGTIPSPGETAAWRLAALARPPVLTLQNISADRQTVRLSVSNLDSDVIALVLDNLASRGVLALTGQDVSSGQATVQLDPAWTWHKIVLRGITNPFTSAPSTPIYVFDVQAGQVSQEVDKVDLYPLPAPHQQLVDLLAQAVPDGTFWLDRQRKTGPSWPDPIPFVLEIPADKLPATVTLHGTGQAWRIVSPRSVVLVSLPDAGLRTWELEIVSDDGQTDRLPVDVAVTWWLWYLDGVGAELYQAVTALKSVEQIVRSPTQTALLVPLLPPTLLDLLARRSTHERLVAIRALVEGLLRDWGTAGGPTRTGQALSGASVLANTYQAGQAVPLPWSWNRLEFWTFLAGWLRFWAAAHLVEPLPDFYDARAGFGHSEDWGTWRYDPTADDEQPGQLVTRAEIGLGGRARTRIMAAAWTVEGRQDVLTSLPVWPDNLWLGESTVGWPRLEPAVYHDLSVTPQDDQVHEAQLQGRLAGPFDDLDGRQLQLNVGTVTFSATGSLTADDVAAQINAQLGPGIWATSDAVGRVVIRRLDGGDLSVVGGDATPRLGFLPTDSDVAVNPDQVPRYRDSQSLRPVELVHGGDVTLAVPASVTAATVASPWNLAGFGQGRFG